MSEANLWGGLNPEAKQSLSSRDYRAATFAQAIATAGVDASELASCDREDMGIKEAWIPGVEIFPRTVFAQRHRGVFGEFARRDQGVLARIGLWPAQWAAARMFAHTAKGFHIHPPALPHDTAPENWFRKLFVDEAETYSLRPYDREQWDVMFFVQGRNEMILRDARIGLPRRTMRFFVDGDNHRSPNNVGVIIPAGVAHALRVEGSEDLIMVYGTSVAFRPDFEGRIASEVETAELPASWQQFLSN
jgi:dTDP-4-dehydrorhamnose 3,5-epimerase-like enzyme